MPRKIVLCAVAAVTVAAALALPVATGPVSTTATTPLDAEEQAFLNLLNQHRGQNGLGPVSIDRNLQGASEWMSTDMGVHNYFSHTDSLGRDPFQRMREFGYNYNTWLGENIAAGTSSGQVVFDLWKNSPGHNANMLNANYKVIGIGRAYTAGSTYGWYWTNDFGGYLVSTPAPSPSPSPALNVDCDGDVDAVDALRILRAVAGLPNTLPPGCVFDGDVDCDGDTDAVDALRILREVAGLGNTLPPGCAPISPP